MGLETSSNKLSIVQTSSLNIGSLPVSNGQIIFLNDINQVYFDYNDIRSHYGGRIRFITSLEKLTKINFNIGLYYLNDVNSLYFYNGEKWYLLHTLDDAKDILFGEDLPEQGQENKLYIKDTEIDIWKNNKYQTVANVNVWDTM